MKNNNWQVKSLGEVAKVKSGFAFKSEEYLNKGVPLVRIGSLNGSSLEFGNETVFVDEKFLTICREFSLKENDVLIAMSGATTGKLALVKQKDLPCLLNQRVGLISIGSEDVLNAKYLFYYLAKGDLRREVLKIAGGSAQPNISPTQIMSFQIPIPPLPIQKQIAEILEQADKSKQKRKEVNKLTDEFLQSAFLEMFGDPNNNPKGWDNGIINDAVEYSEYGTSNKSNQDELGYPILGMANITYEGQLDLTKLSFVELTDDEFKKLKLEQGDIIFNRTNSTELVGKTTYWNKNIDAVLASYLVKLRLNNKFNPVVFSFLLNTTHFKTMFIRRCKKAVGQSNISPTLLKEFPIYFPPLSLQQQFAEIVNKTEALKEKQKQSEQELENLFQSLMQKAFKGGLVS